MPPLFWEVNLTVEHCRQTSGAELSGVGRCDRVRRLIWYTEWAKRAPTALGWLDVYPQLQKIVSQRMTCRFALLYVALLGCAGTSSPAPSVQSSPGLTSSATAVSANALRGTDCHMHLDQSGLGGIAQDGQRVLTALDGAGVHRACVLSPGYHLAPGCDTPDCAAQQEWTQGQNDWAIAEGIKSERLLPFCGVPIGVSWAAEEVKRCAAAGARGLKLHSAGEKFLLAEQDGATAFDRIVKAAATAKIPLLIHVQHSDGKEVKALFAIATDNPDATIIAAHGIASNAQMLADAPANLWIEVSGIVFAPKEAGAHFVGLWRSMDINRVILGSDWPLLHPSEHRAWRNTLKELSGVDTNQMRRVARLYAKRASQTTESKQPFSESDERLRAMLREWDAFQANQENTGQTAPSTAKS